MNLPTANFSFPTLTLFGAGRVRELPGQLARLQIQKPLVVTDRGLLPTRAFAALKTTLEAGTPFEVFSDVHPNPVEADVQAGADRFRSSQCDGVIAFGGGSALDVGKAVRLLLKKPGMRLKDFRFDDDWTGLAPCICIPTTAGTGSEVGRSSVITLTETQQKKVLFHPELMARVVILDPELTVDLPPALTAATGVDALVHCIESFTCPAFHPPCDGIALEGIRLIVEALPRAYANGSDLEARGKMLVAASMGAIAFQKDLGATHSLAHPLSTLCGMHHGTANAVCLAPVMEFNAARQPGLYRRVGLAAGLNLAEATEAAADQATIHFFRKFLAGLGLGKRLSHFQVDRARLDALTDQAYADPCHATNAVPVTREDLRNLYLAAL